LRGKVPLNVKEGGKGPIILEKKKKGKGGGRVPIEGGKKGGEGLA